MHKLFRFGRAAAIVVAAAAALAACTINPPVTPQVTAERAAKIDRVVGVYISNEMRATVWSENRSGDTYKFPIGAASARSIEDAARRTFTRSLAVDGLPPLGAAGSGLDGVLEAQIEGFDFVIPFLKTSTYRAEITYRFTLHSPVGIPVASWVVTGEGARRGKVGFEFARWPGEAATLAIEDAMTKFVEETDRQPEVIKWLRDTAAGAPQS